MSALELDGRGDPSSVSYYAPRRLRAATNDSSIRPILAKLRREHGAYPLVESVPLMPSDELIGAFDGAGPRKRALLIAARFVAVTGLCAGAAVAVAAYSLQAQPREEPKPQREDRATLPATALPKPVQTVSFKLQAHIGDAALSAAGVPMSAAETSGQPLRDSAEQVADGRRAENTAVLPSLRTPSVTAPAPLSAAGWSPAAKDSYDDAEPAEKTQAPAKSQEKKERHVTHSRRTHHVRHHHYVARAPMPPPAEASAAPAAQPSLGEVLRKMFNSD